jgi:hypothetical protein
MSDSIPPDVERQLLLAFSPLDKRALGLAFGTALALLLMCATALSMAIDPQQRVPLYLLDQYLLGYSISALGILAGGAWGLVIGFVGGWFVALTRNLVMAIGLLVIRIRADFATQRDFLDHL